MKFNTNRLWQVSIVPIQGVQRKYYVFSSLYKALDFVKIYTLTHIEETGLPSLNSMNIQPYQRGKLPNVIDEKPLSQWCKENKLHNPKQENKNNE